MIGGNTEGIIEVKTVTRNKIGEHVKEWKPVQTLTGFLDFQGGDARYTSFNAKVQESTHFFICDYEPLDESIKAENSRMIVNGARYDITLIDDPMGMHQQLEIYLKYTGGQ